MKKLENLTWKMTGEVPEHIENKLDEKDKIYYQKYNQLINRYSKTISESDFNLTKDYAPVKDIIIEVRALENIKKADKEKQIKLIYNDALNINIEDEEFDLIFIDAAKAQNIKFFQRFGLYLKSHGFIITDNLNFHGLVDKDLEEIESKNVRGIVRKIREFKEFLLENNDYETVFYDVGDGISVSEKIKE